VKGEELKMETVWGEGEAVKMENRGDCEEESVVEVGYTVEKRERERERERDCMREVDLILTSEREGKIERERERR
jgi:hypothetical protein